MNIIVISPSGALDRAALGELPPDATVRLVTWAAHADDDAVAVPARRSPLRARVLTVAAKNVLGRSALRLSPWDEGAWFWRAARRDPGVVAAAQRADVIVAPERDAIRTAWELARRNTTAAAVFGYPAARAAIRSGAEA
jgi:hypothetical protein